MKVIKSLGTRVETEHSAQLAELRRLEQSSNTTSGISTNNGRNTNGSSGGGGGGGMDSAIDFESLVRGGVGATKKVVPQDMWDDDSLSASGTLTPSIYSTPSISPVISSPQNSNSRSLPTNSTSRINSNSNMGARTISPSNFNSTAFSSPPLPPPPPFSSPPIASYSSFPTMTSPPPPPVSSSLNSFVALQPSSRSVTPLSKPPQQPAYNSNASYGSGKSNYNISLPSQIPSPSTYTSQLPPLQPQLQSQSQSSYGMQPLQPTTSTSSKNSNGWNIVPPATPSPSFGVLVPTVIDRKLNNKVTPSFGDWADLDPLK